MNALSFTSPSALIVNDPSFARVAGVLLMSFAVEYSAASTPAISHAGAMKWEQSITIIARSRAASPQPLRHRPVCAVRLCQQHNARSDR